MKTLVTLFIILFSNIVLTEECGEIISTQSIAHLKEPLTLGDVTKKYGNWCQSHGPVSWYKTDSSQQIWFWWKVPINIPQTQSEFMNYEILAITLVNSEDENSQKIIWPKSLIDEEIGKITSEEYKKFNK